ncbi:hypothetical protein DVH05_015049 [Phytophthora capsici]|nr:hypothetical protein DVH05_015049 [Phytophthora capsici]
MLHFYMYFSDGGLRTARKSSLKADENAKFIGTSSSAREDFYSPATKFSMSCPRTAEREFELLGAKLFRPFNTLEKELPGPSGEELGSKGMMEVVICARLAL